MRPARASAALTATALALLAAAPVPLAAQDIGSTTVIGIPQVVSNRIGTGSAAKTIAQSSFPLAVIVPLTPRLSLDVGTSWAQSQVSSGGRVVSEITGFTDTQVRANYVFGSDAVVLTLGANVPTGQYQVREDQIEAAGQIGNNFLVYPVSAYGNGLSGTGGIAVARSLGSWNLGLGGTFRRSTEFDAFTIGTSRLRFQPADEVRARIGLDRPVGESGRLSIAGIYSAFGEDAFDSTTFATGDRYIGQVGLYLPTERTEWSIGAWNLYRARGQQVGGTAPYENIANLSVGVGVRLGSVVVEPNAEGRLWQVGGARAGQMVSLGARLRLGAGPFTLVPSAGYTAGTFYALSDGASTGLTGWRGSLLIRLH